jgi:hypothetical protein
VHLIVCREPWANTLPPTYSPTLEDKVMVNVDTAVFLESQQMGAAGVVRCPCDH